MHRKPLGLRRIFLAAAVSSACLFGATELAWAPFLDNIGGLSPDHPSRQASAATFTAISQFYAAMAALEVDEQDNAREALGNAIAGLNSARETFGALANSSDLVNRTLRFDLLSDAQRANLLADSSLPRDLPALFTITATSIDRLKGALSEFRENPDIEHYAAARFASDRLLFQGELFSRLLQQ